MDFRTNIRAQLYKGVVANYNQPSLVPACRIHDRM